MAFQNTRSTERFLVSPKGSLLVKSGYANPEQIQTAWQRYLFSGEPFLSILETLVGKPPTSELKLQWKKYQLFESKLLYGVDGFGLDLDIDSIKNITNTIDLLLPLFLCKKYKIIPLKKEPRESADSSYCLDVAMVEPDNWEAVNDLERVFKGKNITLRRKVILEEDYENIINSAWAEQQKQIDDYDHQELKKNLEITEPREMENHDYHEDEDKFEDKLVEESPVVKLVNLILQKSCSENITEVYLEPAEYYLNVRARRNGEIVQILDPLPRKIISAIVNRIKIMSGLDITTRNKVQKGKIKIKINNRRQEFAIKSIPIKYGEKIVIYTLNTLIDKLQMENLIVHPKSLEHLSQILDNGSGLLVVSGLKHSGRTLTSYSILADRNNQGMTVGTVEEQIKYSLPNINQVEITEKKEIDYETVIQSFLMEDIKVIFVDKIPDTNTAKTLVEAGKTGHLVLANISAEDAMATITSLNEIGLSLPTLANSLIGVVNQRLVRRLCSECCAVYKPTKNQAKLFPPQQQNNLNLYRAKIDSSSGQVCPKCKGTGYHGVISIYEILRFSNQIRELMANNADFVAIKNAALQEGMITLFAYGLDLVLNGKTSLEELERMFPQEFDVLTQETEEAVEMTGQSSDGNTLLQGVARLENKLEILTLEIQKISKLLQEGQIKANPQEITPKKKPKNYDVISDPW
jgi:type IV pilus assembly protein PilB